MLNVKKFAMACAITTGIFWIICSFMVMLMPAMMMSMSGHMMHADLSAMQWSLEPAGIIIGLGLWVILAGIFGGLIAFVYNAFVAK